MHEGYDFIVAPQAENAAALADAYEKGIRQAMRSGRQRVLLGEDTEAVCAGLLGGFLR